MKVQQLQVVHLTFQSALMREHSNSKKTRINSQPHAFCLLISKHTSSLTHTNTEQIINMYKELRLGAMRYDSLFILFALILISLRMHHTFGSLCVPSPQTHLNNTTHIHTLSAHTLLVHIRQFNHFECAVCGWHRWNLPEQHSLPSPIQASTNILELRALLLTFIALFAFGLIHAHRALAVFLPLSALFSFFLIHVYR